MLNFSRRWFGKSLGAAAIGSLAGAAPAPEAATVRDDYYSFPNGFLWGCATAAYQVEGGAREDGRGASIWDTFSHTAGKVYNNQTGDVADDEYHRYAQDIRLLKDLGARAYRFSVSWPRIFPRGSGQPNEKGIAFYQRLIDELLSNGIEPFCTLFHWDLPQALQDRFGGWQSRQTSQAFADYAGYVARRLSDRVHHFFTMNEFSSFIDLSYGSGKFAPGLRLSTRELNQAKHFAVLGHGLAVQAIRAGAKPGTRVGLAENFTSGVPVYESEAHVKAARQATRRLNAAYLTVILEGKYMEEYLRDAGSDAPQVEPADLKAIGSPLDFVGANIDTPTFVRADDNKDGFTVVKNPSSYPRMASDWLFIGPEALYWAPRHLNQIWGVREIYITENGCSSADVLTPDGHVWDTDRVMYLRNYLIHLHRAVSEGFPVRGYFLWSLLDNFEWADGYNLRFGITYVEYQSQKRYPKLSSAFYKQTIAKNSVA